ncbi:MAG TPA: HAD-IA family hydrolase [Acidimicrobiales bacterium]|nr:HAD-IA family hydrolase [Acidimicrobiales bacterium]
MSGRAAVTPPAALLLDFDGLILDTETCTYEAVVEVFAAHSQPVDLAWWHTLLGTADHPHWTERLAAQLGRPVDRASLVARREERRLPRIRELAPREGLVDLLEGAGRAGVPCAVVSSSASGWVVPHLDRLGLRHRFRAVVTRDDVDGDATRTKPAPDLYLVAADALAVDPARCVVLEDSPNGVAAGRAAGMVVVAVPVPMTRTLDFGAAHRTVGSLADLDLGALAALVTPS